MKAPLVLNAGGNDPLVYFESGNYYPEGFVSLEWNRTGTLLLAYSLSSRLTVYNSQTEAFIYDYITGNNPVRLTWIDDDTHISNGTTLFNIKSNTYDLLRPNVIPEAWGSCGGTSAIANSTDRQELALGTTNGCVIVIDPMSGDHLAFYKAGGETIRDLDWGRNDLQIATANENGQVNIINTQTSGFVTIDRNQNELFAIDWDASGTQLAFGGEADTEDTLVSMNSIELHQIMSGSLVPLEIKITVEP
ncbi:hypothetical protein HC776_00290 [bacterium]|nr:hypothetical protein [bacterium]